MKILRQKKYMIIFFCAVGIAIALLGRFYFRYVSQNMYEENTNHLVEIYSQVNNNFGAFLERNWGNLNDWTHHLQVEDEEGIQKFIQGRREYWGLSEFYFLSEDGSYITPEGDQGELALEDSRDSLFRQREEIMVSEHLPDGQAVTVFAIPVPRGTYQGMDYTAIAVSYTNADIIRSLDVDAFSGESRCYVVYTDGRVLLSTQSGGSVFGNYLSYLRGGSGLSEKELEQIRRDWEAGVSGVTICGIGGVNYYISYQPVGYQDCVLIGVVPESAASASLQRIQKATLDVLVKVFFLLVLILGALFVSHSRKQTQKSDMELQYRELMFDTLSNNVDDIFLMLDKATWKADYLSPNVERLLGIPLETARKNIRLLGETAGDVKDFSYQEEFAGIPTHGCRIWEREHMHQTTGERHWYREMVYHESIQDVEKYIIVMSDRTQERQMNENLQEALDAAKSANQAKSHFLSNMSHDIRTPMNAIIGFTVLLARDADQADKVRKYTRKISASGHHLLSLINDVLDMSKIESGKTSLNLAQFSLPEFLEELYDIMLPQARAKNQRFEFHIQGMPAEQLLGDKLRLNQILMNLLSNAVKYTQEGGTVDFLMQVLPQHSPQYVQLRFVVRDNGFGMSPEFLENIFAPFTREVSTTTSGIQGTGLGMAITKNLVDLMGGVIQVESEPGRGSTFTVELSFALPEFSDDEEFWSRQGISRVLLADDDQELCADIRNMMQETGVEVSCVNDGAAAVEAVIRARERKEDFDVILLDWKMPGTSGVEAARRIRKEVRETIPIFVLTSYDWSDIEEEARAAGVDAFMPKPFFVSTFRQTIRSLYQDSRPEKAEEDIQENVLEGLLFLVAEDNELNSEILSEMLDIEGAECEIASNGQEALEMFLRSEPERYDMILMDVQMPVMDGYEATRQIRACGHPRAAEIPIVAMTANAFAEDVRNALDAGMDGHLSKPIDMTAVKSLLGRLKSGRNTTEAD